MKLPSRFSLCTRKLDCVLTDALWQHFYTESALRQLSRRMPSRRVALLSDCWHKRSFRVQLSLGDVTFSLVAVYGSNRGGIFLAISKCHKLHLSKWCAAVVGTAFLVSHFGPVTWAAFAVGHFALLASACISVFILCAQSTEWCKFKYFGNVFNSLPSALG